jgi:TIR domain/WD domain, G-beta repeat
LALAELARDKIVGSTAEKPNIFISYARSDGAALAEELVSGLELAGFRSFLDRHDIAAAEDWQARLSALILSADAIVFILSPAAVRSERCAWEAEYAAELGKRLIPVQGIPVPESEVPEKLRRLNYIFFRQDQSFTRPLRQLVTALRQDVEWIREHTRLSEAAARWQTRGSGTRAADDLLLRGVELANAQTWTARRRDDAPAITPLLRAFLTASEAAVEARAQQDRDRLAERERLVAQHEAAQRDTALAQEKVELAQQYVRRVQRRWASVLVTLTVLVILGTGAGLWVVFEGWRSLMVTRSGFIAGIIDRQAGEGDHVTAMLLGLEALPDPSSESIRQRWLPLETTAAQALDGAWRNWRTEWGERVIFAGHTEPVLAIRFSPDGTRVLTGSSDTTARLWDAASGKPIAILAGHKGPVWAVAFSPDGTRVLTGSGDGTARLWDAVSGKPIATLAGHTGFVRATAFSSDGTRILTGSDDNTARLWDAVSGKPIATLAGHTGAVWAVAFSPDGTRVLTGSDDNTARLWRVFKTVQDLVDTVRVSVPRCLTSQQRAAFYLGTPPPRWCYIRKLWPYTDQQVRTTAQP